MAEYSILYFGPAKSVSGYLKQLKKLSCCARLQRSEPFSSAVALSQEFDLVLFEAAPGASLAGKTIAQLAQAFGHIPLVALTTRLATPVIGLNGQVPAEPTVDQGK